MGIRFHCRHCRRSLNVKSTQAGLSGNCPHCGQAIEVPIESTRGSAELTRVQTSSRSVEIFDVDNQITEVGLTPAIQDDADFDAQEFSVPASLTQRSSSNARRSSFSDSSDSFLLDKPQLPSTLGKVDPIEEAPRKVWYYRSKEHGEKGPFKAKAMQAELDSGNVNLGCIVWREDWEDWQPAERVFPSLVAIWEAQQLKRRMGDAKRLIPDELNPYSAIRRRHRNRKLWGMVAIVVGLLIVGALVYYLSRLVSN